VTSGSEVDSGDVLGLLGDDRVDDNRRLAGTSCTPRAPARAR
jgi:hypothetical protein